MKMTSIAGESRRVAEETKAVVTRFCQEQHAGPGEEE